MTLDNILTVVTVVLENGTTVDLQRKWCVSPSTLTPRLISLTILHPQAPLSAMHSLRLCWDTLHKHGPNRETSKFMIDVQEGRGKRSYRYGYMLRYSHVSFSKFPVVRKDLPRVFCF